MNKRGMVRFGTLNVFPPIALAPMVGLSHSAFRSLTIEEGGFGLFYTEMLAARRLPSDTPECSPLLVRTEHEKPLIYQIATADPDTLLPALQKLKRLGADGIDLNLGCPAPVMKKQGAGARLLENRPVLKNSLRLLRNNTDLPLSVKLRLGEKGKPERLVDTCRMMEDYGVDLITLHARFNGEKFCRRPMWSCVKPITEAISIPVFVNGGIFSVGDAEKCLRLSGASGIMLGRGAVEKPWLARQIGEKLYGMVPGRDKTYREIYFRFASLLCERFAPERRLGRLKQFTGYFASNFQFGHHLRSAIQNSLTLDEALYRSKKFFDAAEEALVNQTEQGEN